MQFSAVVLLGTVWPALFFTSIIILSFIAISYFHLFNGILSSTHGCSAPGFLFLILRVQSRIFSTIKSESLKFTFWPSQVTY